MASTGLPSISTLAELAAVQSAPGVPSDALFVLFFWAAFHPPSQPGGQMETLLQTLKTEHPAVQFIKVEAEAADDVSEQFEISVVPTFIMLRGKAVVGKLEGADTKALVSLIAKLKDAPAPPVLPESSGVTAPMSAPAAVGDAKSGGSLEDRLRAIINSSRVMLFMKGSPDAPRCGFSRQMVELLNSVPVSFGHFDILSDNEVREGLKKFSNWPTYPQLYADGNLVGGLDIAKELKEDGSLKEALGLE